MKFPYKKINDRKIRPIVPVTLSYKNREVTFYALIDSGADLNLFPANLLPSLGIELSTGRQGQVGGITDGETQPFYFHKINLEVGGLIFKTEVAFMESLSQMGHGLLGQKGFFDKFLVKFDYRNKEIEVNEHKK